MTTEPKSAEGAVAHAVARAMCERAESIPFEQLPANKSDWTAKGGQFGGRFRDVNEPMQCDYLDLAEAAIGELSPLILDLQRRLGELDTPQLRDNVMRILAENSRLRESNRALVEALEKFCADQDFMPDYVAEALRAAQTGEGNG